MKAIKVQYYPATNTKGSRYTASIKDEQGIIARVTEQYSYDESGDEQPIRLAKELIKKMEWSAEISGVGMYAGDYYITIK